MSEQADMEDRKALIHLLNSGKTTRESAQVLGRSRGWAYKWKDRFEQDGWAGLQAHSRALQHIVWQTATEIRQEIVRIRCALEAEAEAPDSLGYVGGDAI